MASSLKLSELVPGLERGLAFTELAQVKTEGEPCYVDPMAVSLQQLEQELYPGLAAVQASERYRFAYHDWRAVFGTTFEDKLATPHVWVPKLVTPPVLVAGAVAAAIVKNPEVTRRFWRGWFSGGAR